MREHETCDACRFWREDATKSADGQCRRYAPRPRVYATTDDKYDEVFTTWPTAYAYDQCGEFEEK